MPLTPGSRLGPYEIIAALGAGGMGEVYKAKDSRLERTVAIKVLPTHLSDRPELRQRFEREARAISSLSHPHICTLHDVGHQDGVDFLVMEHLEGETLAERLARGPLPAEQVLRFGIEIADALDKAHRQGIVHRDLKPGNIMLSKSGVKLLDFGLAKVVAGAGSTSALEGLTSLPTEAIGGQPLTIEGTLLGTFQYMAPEQLEGKEADARTDLFALGAVLYEMATGRPAFQGKSRASLISSIMSSEPPPIAAAQPLTPPALERVVKTCLAKDPDDRFQTAHDVTLQLQWIAEGGSQAGLPAPVAARRRTRERLAWTVAGAGVLAFVALVGVTLGRRPVAPKTMRFAVPATRGVASIGLPRISPDGSIIAFDATDSTGRAMIWVRPLDALEAQPLQGTEGAGRTFWSPDSRYLAFFSQGKLKKIAVSGGPAQTICDAPTGSDGAWGVQDIILFDGAATDPIRRVPAGGGVAAPAVKGDSANVGWPEFLPDGRHFLYLTIGNTQDKNEINVGSLDSKAVRHLNVHGSRAEYSPAGYLLFVREGTLMAQPFDARRLATTGEPFPVAEQIGGRGFDLAYFSVSRNGVLAYSTGGVASNQLLWVDRSGRTLGTAGSPGALHMPALSPDGARIAVRQIDPQTSNRDLWVLEPARGTSTRFTFDPSVDTTPLWSPDGGRVAFASNRGGGVLNLFQKLATGAGAEETLMTSRSNKYLSDWSADGRFILYWEEGAETQLDLGVLPTFGDRKPFAFLKSPFNEWLGQFSPDGRWVAYTSDESGRNEVYVQSFPGPGGKWQVSTQGGSEPLWRSDGKELFYLATGQRLMSVEIKPGADFLAGVPTPLFQMRATPDGWTRYCAGAGGQRFLVAAPQQNATLAPTTLVLNWNAGIGRK